MHIFQIIFNPTSAAELARMPKELQLQILGEFRGVPTELMSHDPDRFGKLRRGGKLLHKNTLKDFQFRSNLPVAEDEALQDNPKFWALIEEAARGRART